MRNKALTTTIALLLILLMIGVAFCDVDPDNFPRMDVYYQYECADEEDMINKATTGVIDSAIDVRNPANVAMMNTTYGWTTTTTAGYSPHITNINSRDVYPDTAGEMMNYHDRGPGDSNFPLNVSAFRFAIKILWSRPKMDEWVSEIFDWTEEALMTCVTPAHGKWYNTPLDATLQTYDPAMALSVLNTAGFYNTTGDTGHTDGEWWNTNIAIGPLVELRPIYVMCCIEAITSTAAISGKQAQSLIDFFNTHKEYVFDESLDWTFDDLLYATFWDRTFDMSSHGWVLGKNPDYIYDFYHPDMDYPWGDNAPGYSPSQEVSDKMFALKYWRWPNGTYITVEQDMIDICWDLQEDLYYDAPVSYNYVTVQTSCYHPDLADIINTAGYGSDIFLTYMYNYYSGDLTHTAINYANPGPITSLNTGWLSSYYDYEVYGLLIDALWLVEPSALHRDVNWACIDWSQEAWSDVGAGVEYGQKVTFNIRPGMYWHDGTPFTAEDVAFSFRTMKKLRLAQYADIESTLVYSDIIDEHTIDVYMNCTGIWYVYSYVGAAQVFNPNVWGYWWDRVDDIGQAPAIAEAEAWTPWNEDYDDWMAANPYDPKTTNTGDLTCLVGTGPYIFIEWDRIAGVTQCVANRPGAVHGGNPGYWRTGPIVASVNGPTFVESASEVTYDFSVNIENLDWWGNRAYTVNSAEIQCHNGTTVDISGSVPSGNLDNFTTTTTSEISVTLGPGAHAIVIEVEGSETYTLTQPVYVTKKEDTNRDKYVDMMDMYLCALAYGSQRGSVDYDWRFDINKDGWVDMMDLYLIAIAYGEVV